MMIICICANVSDRTVRAMCPTTLDEVMLETGCGMQCGGCLQEALRIINEPVYANRQRGDAQNVVDGGSSPSPGTTGDCT